MSHHFLLEISYYYSLSFYAPFHHLQTSTVNTSLRRRCTVMEMCEEMLCEMLEAFDHPLKNIDELSKLFGENVG